VREITSRQLVQLASSHVTRLGIKILHEWVDDKEQRYLGANQVHKSGTATLTQMSAQNA
jgi:hypothetical protein